MPNSPKPAGGQGRRDPRMAFRDQSHAAAHAAARRAPRSVIPDHPSIPQDQPQLINSPTELADLVAHVREAGHFAYDSEFIGERSYYPKLCLIQICTIRRIALVDPLRGLDLEPIWQLIADPRVLKIVHAGEQDLEPCLRLTGRLPANVFDTQIACGFIGLAYPSALSKLVRQLLGVQLGKGLTFTHWDHRPLSDVQLAYAADDVRYLPALHERIVQRLDEMGNRQWAMEECASLCEVEAYERGGLAAHLRLRGAGELLPRNAAVLRELYQWRQEAARRHDTPPRAYLKDSILVDMARQPPTELADLDRVRGLPRPVEQAEGPAILDAVRRGLAIPLEEPPPTPTEETPAERFMTDACWAMVQTWAFGRGIDASLVGTRGDVADFCRAWREGRVDEQSWLMRGWRGQLLGPSLLAMLRGEGELRVRCHQGALRCELSPRVAG